MVSYIPHPLVALSPDSDCNSQHDYSDLQEKVEDILGNYNNYRYIIENARKKFSELYRPENVALHVYNIFKSLNGVAYE